MRVTAPGRKAATTSGRTSGGAMSWEPNRANG
jgi:hypothetical protein